MPEIGEIRKGKEIGYKSKSCKYIWHACEMCNKEQWEQIVRGEPRYKKCHKCASASDERRANLRGELNNQWKGGRRKHGGYVEILLQPDDFFYPMTDKTHYVREHRLVMAKSLGRNLHPWEVVHHKNGIRTDNRIENLQLISDLGHKQLTMLENRIAKLEQKIKDLSTEIRLLRLENKELTKKRVKQYKKRGKRQGD